MQACGHVIPGEPLFLEIDTLHTIAHAGHYFIRNGIEPFRQGGGGQFFSEDDDRISFAAGDVCDVYHAHVHADVAHIFGFLTLHKAVSMPVA